MSNASFPPTPIAVVRTFDVTRAERVGRGGGSRRGDDARPTGEGGVCGRVIEGPSKVTRGKHAPLWSAILAVLLSVTTRPNDRSWSRLARQWNDHVGHIPQLTSNLEINLNIIYNVYACRSEQIHVTHLSSPLQKSTDHKELLWQKNLLFTSNQFIVSLVGRMSEPCLCPVVLPTLSHRQL